MFETDAYSDLFARIAAVRGRREEFLDSVRAGDVALEAIFSVGAIDAVIGSMKVLPAVESLPDSGKVQTRRAFEAVDIAEDDLVSKVSAAQVRGLRSALELHAR